MRAALRASVPKAGTRPLGRPARAFRAGAALARVPVYLGALAITAYCVLPFLWLVIGSLQTEREIVSVPPHWVPQELTLENYGHLVYGPPVDPGGRIRLPEEGRFIPTIARDFLPAMRNSLGVGVAVAAINLLLASMAAYAFSRLRFRGQRRLPLAVLGIRLIPDIALVVPFFLMMRSLELIDSPLSLVIMYVGLTLPFSIFILAGYFGTIPHELDEAALVDGCTRLQALRHVILPVALPGLIATAVFSFMTCWNEFLFALVLTKTTASVTLPVILASFTQDFNISFAFMNAAAVVSVLPPVVLALLFRRYLAAGLAMGAVKG